MTKLYLTAIRNLPERYVRDGTQVIEVTTPRYVVAINPMMPPILYAPKAGKGHKWKRLRLVPAGAADVPTTETPPMAFRAIPLP